MILCMYMYRVSTWSEYALQQCVYLNSKCSATGNNIREEAELQTHDNIHFNVSQTTLLMEWNKRRHCPKMLQIPNDKSWRFD